MEQEILNQLAEFSLKEDENILIEFEERDVKDGIAECKRSCYGRFYAGKEIDVKGLRWAMTKAWNCERIRIKKLHDQIMQIFFSNEEEANRVVEQGPWYFDKELLIVKPWKYGEIIKVEDFQESPLWIHVKGLPFECYTKDMAMRIGKNFPGCTVIQVRECVEDGGRFFRMRSTINLFKPLRRTIILRGPNGKHLYALRRYETLPIMCFKCGLIGHTVKKCTLTGTSQEETQDFQYGMWLNADFTKSSILQTVELNRPTRLSATEE